MNGYGAHYVHFSGELDYTYVNDDLVSDYYSYGRIYLDRLFQISFKNIGG